ncbi:MAG TPA: nuclear transport factor 2 family protein [Myxococcaceae bacterium]|nr:nuclear transport factor 2 family protein [Myxococcaceae bacterium]
MSQSRAKQFIEALHTLEQKGDLEPLVSLFSDAAELSNLAAPRVFRGPEAIRQFWREYRGTFRELRSDFRNVIESGDRVALEWETTGTAHTGAPIEYQGVSILEFDGDRLNRFFAYFDPSALGREIGDTTHQNLGA